ncbi:hypothetical protein PDIG_26720 [Penicillium digitatum PHI26]|uniref:Uncharacterized protein n=2 Tax=Penicillium digitatum TaxID=36651 RepID=K9G229_PEND2|nr:hypothetical protein PDIP_61170 [Penicillium digitatum Pd1]EKV10271.1 hypothetical protein PDIP_61170 [Penicillium digitatum Pd1]EKV15369.1 hypothetical protein PDIG_26720 [Penicillium digitatum PHI26]
MFEAIFRGFWLIFWSQSISTWKRHLAHFTGPIVVKSRGATR